VIGAVVFMKGPSLAKLLYRAEGLLYGKEAPLVDNDDILVAVLGDVLLESFYEFGRLHPTIIAGPGRREKLPEFVPPVLEPGMQTQKTKFKPTDEALFQSKKAKFPTLAPLLEYLRQCELSGAARRKELGSKEW
jgi:hypothetical protein